MTGHEEFVGEELLPVVGTTDLSAMSRGEPGLPQRFTWREREYRIVGVIGKWKSSGPCRGGGKEIYLRRHWYKVITVPGATMTIYFDRQARNPNRPKARWWIYTMQLGHHLPEGSVGHTS